MKIEPGTRWRHSKNGRHYIIDKISRLESSTVCQHLEGTILVTYHEEGLADIEFSRPLVEWVEGIKDGTKEAWRFVWAPVIHECSL